MLTTSQVATQNSVLWVREEKSVCHEQHLSHQGRQAFTYVFSISSPGEITGEENLLAQSYTALGEEVMWVKSNLDLFALVVQLFQ